MSMHHRNRINRIMDINWKQYKLRLLIDKTAENIHHILWKGWWHNREYNVNIPENKLKINAIRHQCINDLFWALQTPHEQLRFMYDIRKSILSERTKKDILDILSREKTDFYIDDLYKRCKQKKKWENNLKK